MKRLLLALLLLAAAAADAQIPGSRIAQSGGGVSSGGSGTVTSVGIAGTGGLTASPSPIVGAGTITLNAFTSGLPGGVLASGGGTTNFLRADGTWAAPGGFGHPVITVFTSNGTYTPGGGITTTCVLAVGPGGGGGGGAQIASGTASSGGGGRRAGTRTYSCFKTADLGGTPAVPLKAGDIRGARAATSRCSR